ncbi:MAG: site-specific integrase [Acidobacteriota bacterium]|nr:site-specific integrase [Acidobacteriota bacterium]
MSVSEDKARGTWYVQCRYKDWTGQPKKKTKRGFATKKAALAWEREFLARINGTPDMTMREFYCIYEEDLRTRIRRNTWETKAYLIEKKILPFFGKMKVNEISSRDIMRWQNEMMGMKTSVGLPFSETYLNTLSCQLSALFNHAVKYYNLPSNPMLKADRMGSSKASEMDFWTKDEYMAFSIAMMDKPQSFLAFELLYWCGMRCGELLALTPSDFDFQKSTVSITKSYQRIRGEDVVTDPKTKKSVRTIAMPEFLSEEVEDYLRLHPGIQGDERMLPVSKNYLHREMDRGCKETGAKRIRIHDLRHSHVSLLIEMGYSPLAIADRLGHESQQVTLTYAHLFPNKQEEMAQKLDEIRSNPFDKEEW